MTSRPEAADTADVKLPELPDVYVWHTKGSFDFRRGSQRITDAFDNLYAPKVGSLGIALSDSLEEVDGELVVVGLGVVAGIAGVARGAVRAAVAPVYSLQEMITFDSLLESLGEDAPRLDAPQHFYVEDVPSRVARRLLSELVRREPPLVEWLVQVLGPRPEFTPSVRQARAEVADAVRTAADFAGIALPENALRSGEPAGEESVLQTVVNAAHMFDLEEEMLPLDLQRFDGHLKGRLAAASTAVFSDTNGEERLVVVSVNKKPIEEVMGVDLYYWDLVHDAFTFVQYKRLERDSVTGEDGRVGWVYKKRRELQRQIDLMPAGEQQPRSSQEWRAFQTPFWFKFVRGDAGKHDDGKVLKGMYVPADWLRLALGDDSLMVGPRGGFRLGYDNARYLTRGPFVQLVARGFVGTVGQRTKRFQRVVKRLGRDRELIIAVREEWSEDDSGVGDAEAPF